MKKKILCSFTVLLLLLLLCSLQCLRIVRISGSSMEPSFSDGDFAAAKKVRQDTGLSKGDVIVFHHEAEKGLLIKRITAMPGETVMYQGHPIRLAEDEYFVTGDHSDASVDSRQFGPVKRSDIRCLVLSRK